MYGNVEWQDMENGIMQLCFTQMSINPLTQSNP